MGSQGAGASSSTRLQPQLTSSSLGVMPVLDSDGDVRGMFANVITGFEELRRDMTKRISRVEEKAQQRLEKLRDELANAVSQAKCNQVQLVQNTDQCLVESLNPVTKKSEETTE